MRAGGGPRPDPDEMAQAHSKIVAIGHSTGLTDCETDCGKGVVMKRIVAFWPYVLIVLSLVGLAYTFLAASQLR